MRLMAIILLCCCAAPAQAALLQYEPFNYQDLGPTLEGKTTPTGGTRVSAYSSAVAPGLIKVGSGTLTVPPELKPAIGNSVEIDGGPSSVATDPQQLGNALRLPFGGGLAVDSGGT